MRLHSLSQSLILFVIAFIPDDLIHPEDLLMQHDFHHLLRVGEGSVADFLLGPVLYTVSYAIAAADDEYDVAFSCVHPFLIFFSEFFAGVCSAPDFEGDDVLHVFDFAEYLLGFFFFYDLYVSISGIVWFFFIGNFY